MDTFTLTQGWQKGAIPATTLERLARGDKSARFQTRGRHERFRGHEPTKFLQRWGFCPTGVTILDRSSKGEGNCQKVDLAQRSCLET
jgi:hypothetical protein